MAQVSRLKPGFLRLDGWSPTGLRLTPGDWFLSGDGWVALQENNAATSLQDLVWTGGRAIGTFLVCSRYLTHGVVLVQDSTIRTGRPISIQGIRAAHLAALSGCGL
jgi:hypothetical protein